MKKYAHFFRYFCIGLFTTLLIFGIFYAFYFVEYNTKQNGFFTSSDLLVYKKYNDIVQVGFMGFETKIDTLNTKEKVDIFSKKIDMLLPPEIKMLKFSSCYFDYVGQIFLEKHQDFFKSLSISDES